MQTGEPEYGAFIRQLLIDTTWLRRRVETVHFLNEATLERRVTVDVDSGILRRIATAQGVPLGRGGSSTSPVVPIPLARLEKELILDLDLRDGDGNARPILGRSEDSVHAAAALMEHVRGDAEVDATDRVWIEGVLSRICRSFPDRQDLLTIADGAGGQIALWRLLPEEIADDFNRPRVWRECLARNTQLRRDLLRYTTAFLLMTQMRLTGERVIFKYRYEQPVSTDDVYGEHREQWAERLGFRPFVGVLAATVGWGSSQHLRLVAPPGLFLTAADLVEDRTGPGGRPYTPPAGDGAFVGSPYGLRVTPRRAHLYTGSVIDGRYHVLFTLRCVAAGLWSIVPWVAAYTTILLMIGGAFPSLVAEVRTGSADAAVTLLLLAPSVMSAYAIRPGEHELAARLARWPRRIAGVTVAVAALTALQFVFWGNRPVVTHVVWGIGAAVSGAVCAYVTIVNRVIFIARRTLDPESRTMTHHTRVRG